MQGSIQATLVAAPLELAYLYKQSAQHYIAQAEVITLVGVFSILIGASICWLSGAILGPAVLSKVCAGVTGGALSVQRADSAAYSPMATRKSIKLQNIMFYHKGLANELLTKCQACFTQCSTLHLHCSLYTDISWRLDCPIRLSVRSDCLGRSS